MMMDKQEPMSVEEAIKYYEKEKEKCKAIGEYPCPDCEFAERNILPHLRRLQQLEAAIAGAEGELPEGRNGSCYERLIFQPIIAAKNLRISDLEQENERLKAQLAIETDGCEDCPALINREQQLAAKTAELNTLKERYDELHDQRFREARRADNLSAENAKLKGEVEAQAKFIKELVDENEAFRKDRFLPSIEIGRLTAELAAIRERAGEGKLLDFLDNWGYRRENLLKVNDDEWRKVAAALHKHLTTKGE